MRDMTTKVRFGDYCFHICSAEEDGLMELCMEEWDYDAHKEENYIADHCLATLSPDEVEYLAHRLLDAVAYQRKQNGLLSNEG